MKGPPQRPARTLAWWSLVILASAYPILSRIDGHRPWWGDLALFGQGSVHAAALAGVALLPLVLLGRARWGKVVGVLCAALVALAVAIDARLFGLTGMHLGRDAFEHLAQPRAMTTLGLQGADLLEVTLVLLAILAVGGLASQQLPELRRHLWVTALLLLVDVGWTAAEVVARFEGATATTGLTAALPLQWRPHGERVLMRLLDKAPSRLVVDYAFPDPEPLPPEKFALAAYPFPSRADRRPDVLLVLVETLRADALAAAPNLARFRMENVTSAHHDSGGNCTFLGVFTALTALNPNYWGAKETWRAPLGLGAFVALGYDVVLKSSTMLDHDIVQRVLPPGAGAILPSSNEEPPVRDAEAVAAAIEWIGATRKRPSLMVIFIESTHWPFALNDGSPKPGDFLQVSQKAEVFRARYLRSVAEADSRLGEIFRAAAASGRAASLVVGVVGDHGEAFGEHGVFMHGIRLDEEQLRVPLALRLPGIGARVVPGPSTNQDILPTILGYLGASERSTLSGQGVDLLSRQPRPANALVGSCGVVQTLGYAALSGDEKLILQIDRNGVDYLGRVGADDVRDQSLLVTPSIRALLAQQTEAAGALLVR